MNHFDVTMPEYWNLYNKTGVYEPPKLLRHGYAIITRQIAPPPSFFTVDDFGNCRGVKELFGFFRFNVLRPAVGELFEKDAYFFMNHDLDKYIASIEEAEGLEKEQILATEFWETVSAMKIEESPKGLRELKALVEIFEQVFSKIGRHYFYCRIVGPDEDILKVWMEFFELDEYEDREELYRLAHAFRSGSHEEITEILMDH